MPKFRINIMEFRFKTFLPSSLSSPDIWFESWVSSCYTKGSTKKEQYKVVFALKNGFNAIFPTFASILDCMLAHIRELLIEPLIWNNAWVLWKYIQDGNIGFYCIIYSSKIHMNIDFTRFRKNYCWEIMEIWFLFVY